MKNYNGYGSISKLSGKRRRPWVVRITTGWVWDPDLMKNKQIQKCIGYYATRQEAIKALADYNADPFELDALTVTFAQCYDEAHKSFTAGRVANYDAAYKKYLGSIKDKPIRSIKTAHMQKCIDSCTTTQQREIKTVCRKVFEYALYAEFVDHNPADHLKSNNVKPTINRNVFTLQEIEQIENGSDWFYNALACLLYTGMRTKELRTLSADDIDLENMIINIRTAKNKTSIRQIPLHTHAEPFFRRYKDEGIGFYGKSHDNFNYDVMHAFETEHHPHDTRHTFTTRMRECGADPLVLQKLLGHTPETITERVYTHITIDEMRKNIELLHY